MNGLAVVPRSSIPMGGRILRLGDEGRDVKELQTELGKLGFYRGPVDGQYGLLTEDAVINLQKVLGLSMDGLAGRSVFRAVLREDEPLWGLYKVRQGDSLVKIAEGFGVDHKAIRIPPLARSLATGSPLIIPMRNLWIWKEEMWPEAGVSGVLDQTAEENSSSLPCHKVIDGRVFFGKKPVKQDVDVIDARGFTVLELKRLLRMVHLHRHRAWIWLDQQVFQIPGTARYLGLERNKRPIMGLIIAHEPTVRHSQIPALPMPIMLSIDLRATLWEDGKEHRITAKEARHRILLADSSVERQGKFGWAVWRKSGERYGYTVISPDQVTLEAVYREIINKGRMGLVVTGIETPTRRLIAQRRKYFAIVRDMNGIPLTYI